MARRMPPSPTAAMLGTLLVCDCGGFSYSLKGIVATGDLVRVDLA